MKTYKVNKINRYAWAPLAVVFVIVMSLKATLEIPISLREISLFSMLTAFLYMTPRVFELRIEDGKVKFRDLFSRCSASLSEYEGRDVSGGSDGPIRRLLFWTDSGIVSIRTALLRAGDHDELEQLCQNSSDLWRSRTFRSRRETRNAYFFLPGSRLVMYVLLTPTDAIDTWLYVLNLSLIFLLFIPYILLATLRIKVFRGRLYYHSLFKRCINRTSHYRGFSGNTVLLDDELGRTIKLSTWGLSQKDKCWCRPLYRQNSTH